MKQTLTMWWQRRPSKARALQVPWVVPHRLLPRAWLDPRRAHGSCWEQDTLSAGAQQSNRQHETSESAALVDVCLHAWEAHAKPCCICGVCLYWGRASAQQAAVQLAQAWP